MIGPGFITMLMFLALAVVAYAEAAPRSTFRDRVNLFEHASDAAQCPLGTYYSSFYHACAHKQAKLAH